MPVIIKPPGEERNDLALGDFFNLREFSCNCRKYCGESVVYEPTLVHGLLFLREKLSLLHDEGYAKSQAVIVNCSYRCWMHNKDIGGVDSSEHLFLDGHAATDLATWKNGLSPLEFGLLIFGQSRGDVDKKYPKLTTEHRHFIASRIEIFRRVGVYGIEIDKPGYHGKRNFVHAGIKDKKLPDGTILPDRWGDWPHLVEFYREHPEKYNPKPKGRG